MFRVSGNQISITAGDTALMAICPDETGYVPTANDRAIFTVRERPKRGALIEKTIAPEADGRFVVCFESEDTARLKPREYVWDVRLAIQANVDENGEVTDVPYDQATYMDVAPEDKCENVRREICLTLERMGIQPESSHHEEGPGQNEVDFRYSDPLSAADNAVTFLTVVKTIAARNGLYADFSPRPLEGRPGSGFHINMSVQGGADDLMHRAMGGILDKITDMTLFLNPTEQSYSRLGAHKAPKYISWSSNNRSQLIRVPAASGEYRRFELRSPDCTANPYLAFALLIWAGLSGIENNIALPEACNVNLHTADSRNVTLATLPKSLADAEKCAADSNFIAQHLPQSLIEFFTK